MTKTIFIFFVTVLFVGVGVWLFVEKNKNVADKSAAGLGSLETTASPSPSASGKSTMTTLPDGLQIEDVVVGTGTIAQKGNALAVHYVGTLQNGTKFDSSYDRNQPFQFILGGGMVIRGWDEGLAGMKAGGKRKLIIPPELGYGSRDLGKIPPNSTLIFEVELLAVQEVKPQQ